jgi:hypothetical protein
MMLSILMHRVTRPEYMFSIFAADLVAMKYVADQLLAGI